MAELNWSVADEQQLDFDQEELLDKISDPVLELKLSKIIEYHKEIKTFSRYIFGP